MVRKKRSEKRYTARKTKRERSKRNLLLRRIIVTVLSLAIVAATVFFLIIQKNGDQVSVAENAIGSLLTPVQNVCSSAARSVKKFFTTWRDYDALEKEFDVLTQENMQLTLELGDANEALEENTRLKSLLNAQSAYEALDPIYARVIARDAGQWFFTFTINRGSASGVSAGMAVVNSDGLIGRVIDCGMNYANVLSIIDSRSGAACLIQRTRDNCVLRGGVEDSDDRCECMAYYLPNLNNIIPGDVLITSGTDSVYPKGLTVGTVTELSLTAGADGNYAVVTPSVDFKHLEEVLVLRTVIESGENDHASLLTPSPAPTPEPTPEPAVTPTPDPNVEANWERPSAIITEDGLIERLPEDDWVNR